MPAKPSSTRRPHSRRCFIQRTGNPPYIRIVVKYPSFRTIHDFGRLLSSLANFTRHPKQRFMEFTQIGHLGRPIIHLHINITSVFAIPRREKFIIPYSLQIGRLSARLGRTDQQIAAKLKIGGHQTGIMGCFKFFYPFIGRKLLRTPRSQI